MITRINSMILTLLLAGSLSASGVPITFAESGGGSGGGTDDSSSSVSSSRQSENEVRGRVAEGETEVRGREAENETRGRIAEGETEVRGRIAEGEVELRGRANENESEIRSKVSSKVTIKKNSNKSKSSSSKIKKSSSNNGKKESGKSLIRRRMLLSGTATGSSAPKGHTDWRFLPRNRGERITAEVQNMNLPSGTVLTVNACGSENIGTITLNGLHRGELKLQEIRGDSVPTCEHGDAVSVLNNGTAILSGSF